MIRSRLFAALAAALFPLATGCVKSSDASAAANLASFMMCQRVLVDKIEKGQAWDRFVRPQVTGVFSVKSASVEVDSASGVVTATINSVPRQALYRDGLGCTPIVEETVNTLKGQAFEAPPPVALDDASPWPSGGAGPDETVLSAEQKSGVEAAIQNNLFGRPAVRMHAAAVAHKGKLVFEKYDAPHVGPDTPLIGYSMGKTVVALGLGILHGEGAFDIDEALFIHNWTGDPAPSGTYNHFLKMESGIEWNEYGTPSKGVLSDDLKAFSEHGDQAQFAASKRQVAPPGSRYEYASGNTMLLQRSLQNILTVDPEASAAARLQTGVTFYVNKLFAPMHVKSALFQPDEAGNLVAPTMSARDWLRFGELVRNEGAVDGNQVVPAGWIKDRMLKPSVHNPLYGGHIVLDPDVRARKRGSQDTFVDGTKPHAISFLRGAGGQRVFVVPDMQLVMVVICNASPETNSGANALNALREVMYALRDPNQAEW